MSSECWALFPEWSPYFSKFCPRPSGLPLPLPFWLLFPLNSPSHMSCCFPGRWIFPHFRAQFHLCISYLIFAYHQIPSYLFCRCSSLAHTSLLLYVVNELSFSTCFYLFRLCLCHPQIAGCLFLYRVLIFLLRHLRLCPWLSTSAINTVGNIGSLCLVPPAGCKPASFLPTYSHCCLSIFIDVS